MLKFFHTSGSKYLKLCLQLHLSVVPIVLCCAGCSGYMSIGLANHSKLSEVSQIEQHDALGHEKPLCRSEKQILENHALWRLERIVEFDEQGEISSARNKWYFNGVGIMAVEEFHHGGERSFTVTNVTDVPKDTFYYLNHYTGRSASSYDWSHGEDHYIRLSVSDKSTYISIISKQRYEPVAVFVVQDGIITVASPRDWKAVYKDHIATKEVLKKELDFEPEYSKRFLQHLEFLEIKLPGK